MRGFSLNGCYSLVPVQRRPRLRPRLEAGETTHAHAHVPEWDGITRPKTLTEDELRVRMELADAAKQYDWPMVLRILDDA